MAVPILIKRVAEAAEARQLFGRDATVVVSASAGPDSTALVHALAGLNEHFGYRLNLHLAHLHHGLRGEDADADAAFVEALADGLGLPRTVERRDIAALAGRGRGGTEEVARQERYQFLQRVCLAQNARVVAVGHHADDHVETVLFRILRGTGLRGVAGMTYERPLERGTRVRVVRPLLGVTREEILAFLHEAGHAYREDASNTLADTARNRIRHQLLPHLERDFNPQVREAILRLAEQAQWASDYLRETVDKVFATLVISRTDQELVLNAAALRRKDRIVQTEVVRAAIAAFDIGEQDLTFGHLKSVTDLLNSDDASGKQVTLPGGMTVRQQYERLVIALPTDEPRESIAEQVAVHLPGTTRLPVRRLTLTCTRRPVSAEEVAARMHNRDRFEEWMDLRRVQPPLLVRGRQPGARFWPLGAPGSKKIADFLSDLRVDPAQRDEVAVLCDQLGPIWVIGYRLDERVKLTRMTREVLCVRAEPMD